MLLKIRKVGEIRPAESIDRLVVVANDTDVVGGELFDEIQLSVVGVLKLVNYDVSVALAIPLQ